MTKEQIQKIERVTKEEFDLSVEIITIQGDTTEYQAVLKGRDAIKYLEIESEYQKNFKGGFTDPIDALMDLYGAILWSFLESEH